MILAGDIGGTNTRLAFFDKGGILGEEKTYPSQKYGSLEEIVQDFLKGKKVEKACFGVAGPVRNGKSKITNLSWTIDQERMSKTLRIPVVRLLNDLEANAYGIQVLGKEDLFLLHPGMPQAGNRALIAAGTGLGEAGLFWDGKTHRPFACEGGHTDFAPRNPMEIELWIQLKKRFGHVSYERVVSGPGLQILFHFLIDTGKESWDPAVKKEMEEEDPARVISDWGKSGKDRACARALDWWISLYGSEAGNLALKLLSTGGFYIGGGIAPHLLEILQKGGFHSAFIDKGRFQGLLESIPIWVILNDQAALLGAGHYLLTDGA